MHWTLTLLTTPTSSTSLSFLLSFPHAKYLINTPESTQRAFVQKRISMKRLDGIFLTGGEVDCLGGLAGVLMSAADGGVGKVRIGGGRMVGQYLTSCRTFVQRDNLEVDLLDVPSSSDTPILSTSHLTVRAIRLLPSGEPARESRKRKKKEKRGENGVKKEIVITEMGEGGENSEKTDGIEGDVVLAEVEVEESDILDTQSDISEEEIPSTVLAEKEIDLFDPSLRLSNLSANQLAQWRRLVLGGMFTGGPSQAKAAEVVSEKAAAGAKGEVDGKGLESKGDDQPASAEEMAMNDESSKTMDAAENPKLEGKSAHPAPTRRSNPYPNNPSRMHMNESLPLFGLEERPPSSSGHQIRQSISREKVAYIFQAPTVRGKFDVQKSKDLGVPNGPVRGRLAQGQEVEFEIEVEVEIDGKKEKRKEMRKVRPEDVLGEVQDGGAVIVVDVTLAHLEALFASAEMKEYQEQSVSQGSKGTSTPIPTSTQAKKANVVVHRVSTPVLAKKEYQEWMRAFGPETHHLIADVQTYKDALTFTSSAWNLVKMSLMDEEIFPPARVEEEKKGKKEVKIVAGASITTAVQDLEVKIFPPGKPGRRVIVKEEPNYPSTSEEMQAAKDLLREEMAPYMKLVETAHTNIKSAPSESDEPNDYGIKVTPLGTGSAVPSKHRNVSSTLLEIPGFGNVLLDAGEGTLGQLRRRFGLEGMKAVYKDLKFIFVSHMHADHHMGLRAILLDRLQYGPEQMLYLMAPNWILQNLEEGRMFPRDSDIKLRFIDNFCTDGGPPPSDSENLSQLWRHSKTGDLRYRYSVKASRERSQYTLALAKEEMGLTVARTVDVNHRGRAWGLVLQHQDGWKIAYSGDTMPCEALVEAGQDATLLIHEATIEDDKPEVAHAKGHSTFGQAIEMGEQMRAKYILLNHFSQRYPKMPKLQKRDDTIGPRIAMAFDLMSLPLSSFKKMPMYTEALEVLFEEFEGSDTDGEVDEAPEGKAKKVAGKAENWTLENVARQKQNKKQKQESGKGKAETPDKQEKGSKTKTKAQKGQKRSGEETESKEESKEQSNKRQKVGI